MPKPRGRKITGILLLDKPINMSSNQALQRVKRLYNAAKAGHTGSLDMLASGMLPICFGQATKFSQYLLQADKQYEVEAVLGIKTATGDAEGEVIDRRPVGRWVRPRLMQVLKRFRGQIEQTPSMYSALKHNGKRLYELARQGIEVERKPRPVIIYALKLLGLERERFRCYVKCSKGTYIRTLIEDIGEALGCGAYVTRLHRTSVAHFNTEQMVTLEYLEALAREKNYSALNEQLLPIASALSQWPRVYINEVSYFYLTEGQAIWVPKAPTAGYVQLYDENSTFIGMGEVLDDGRIGPKRMLKRIPSQV